jgi:hypothetical protein
MNAPLVLFHEDKVKLDVIQACCNNYEVGDESAEWPNNILSRKTIVYGNGSIARAGDAIAFSVEPEELALCQQLVASLALTMKGASVGMGSESEDPFHEFFITAFTTESIPNVIDAEVVREKFGGTIFPPATIVVEPLQTDGNWWEAVDADAENFEEAEREEYLAPWKNMIAWFKANPDLQSPVFVQIGDCDGLQDLEELPEGTELAPGVLPRLALALTPKGSLIGLFGFVVQT